ncbi:MAG: class I SAM-dependent methyltransferase [Sphingomonadaceae bacterium]
MKHAFKALATVAVAAALVGGAAAPFNNSTRPADDVARDGARKPFAMIAFAKISKGQAVVDMLPGGGYFTRLFAQTVGPKGKVVALVSDQYAKAVPKAATDIQALAAEPAYANVEAAIRNLGDVGAPGSVDRVWTAQNYHDLHGASLPKGTVEGLNRAIFAALKPGGMYIILDHSAAQGTGVTTVDTLHRIDAATVKAEVTSVGFTFGGESKVLANAGDDRSKNVFDPAIRGKTDQFVYRFIKPAK